MNKGKMCGTLKTQMGFADLVEGILEIVPEAKQECKRAKSIEPEVAPKHEKGVKHQAFELARVTDGEGGTVVLQHYEGKILITVRWSHPNGSYEYISRCYRYISPTVSSDSSAIEKVAQSLQELQLQVKKESKETAKKEPAREEIIEETEKVERVDGSEVIQRYSAAKIETHGSSVFEGLEKIERVGNIERIEKHKKIRKIQG